MERALFIESLTLREQQLEVHRASLAAQLRGPEPATEPQTLNCLRILSENVQIFALLVFNFNNYFAFFANF